MAPKFGTSGLRGLVTELAEPLVRDYTRAFLAACETSGHLFVGRDLRPSSPQIAAWVIDDAVAAGLEVHDCGAVPTPALALAAKGAAAIMVTGSHIPADRNGLKFYVPNGEISKADETNILSALGRPAPKGPLGHMAPFDASAAYIARYVQAFGDTALSGLRIGVYQHSSVARDLLMEALQGLGAEPVAIARSETFIPVDTEALDPATQSLFAGWFAEHSLDALVSTDGDADRPMVVAGGARVVAGDVLGALTAQALGADVICTPVSSNTQVDGLFRTVHRTRIGSPHVIAAMEASQAETSGARVVGYEANGGTLLGFEALGPSGSIAPLMTRDCLLPIVAPLAFAKTHNKTLNSLIETLPARFTAADRLQDIATEASAAFLETLKSNAAERAAFFETGTAEASVDLTDGLRVTFEGGDIVHLRPSGNAPEFRCYVEAGTPERTSELLAIHLGRLQQRLG